MNRLIVLLLAAVDATIAVAVGIAAILAPLTVLWVVALPGADWAALWPTTASIWQFAMLVPLSIQLPAEYLTATGIDAAAASFTLSLAPLAFVAFVVVFAARSGMRASNAEAWITGVSTATVTVAALASVIALTSMNDAAGVEVWQAVLFPTLLFGLPAVAGAIATEWRDAGNGAIASVREWCGRSSEEWAQVPGLIVRGTAIVIIGMVGAAAVLTAVALTLRAGEIVALYQSSNVDALGAVMVTLAQFAYLPTLIVWAIAFIAGPGVTLGAGFVVAPTGVTSGIMPGIPLFGMLPDEVSGWLLLLTLVPVGFGVFAGWVARSRLVVAQESFGHADESSRERIGPRLAIAGGIAVLSAASCAVLAAVASGSLGPGSLAQLGPEAGPVALVIGLEVALGVSILLLSPRREATDDLPSNEAQLTAPLD